MEYVLNLKLFYPMLFTTIGIIAIAFIFATKSVLEKYKYSNEHIDTTGKIKDIATEITTDTTDKFKDVTMEALGRTAVDVEQEFHSLHVDIKETNKRMLALIEEINDKVDILTTRVVQLEREKQN